MHAPDFRLRGTNCPRHLGCGLLAASLLVIGVGLSACQSPFSDRTDTDAYSLIAARQRQALGGNSDSQIGIGDDPGGASAHMFDRVPPTINEIRPSSTAASAPAAAPPASQAATAAPAEANPEELLKNLPGIELDKMPELPVFPKPLPAGKTRRTLNLDDAFNVALAHNRDYMTNKEDLYLTALTVALQRHVFEPQGFASTTIGLAGDGEASDYAAAFNATQTVGLRQKLPNGGQIIAQALASTIQEVRESVSTAKSNDLTLTATLPLLRGAGSVAQEELIAAERSMVYQVRRFERYRRGFLVTVATQYFSLVNQRAQIINRFSNVRSYIFITERSKALFEAGMARRRTTLLDVMRAAQSEYQARSSLIGAIESYEVALDRFKLLLGMPMEEAIDVTPQYMTIAPPNLAESQAVELAMALRLDLQSVRDQVDDARRKVKNSTNNLLPDLTLKASVGVDNPANFQPRYENLNYAAGVTFDWPLDRVAEQNALRSAQVGLDRAKRLVETQESQVVADVRAAVRAVKQQQVVLAIQKYNIELAQKRKAFSDIQFRDGKIDNRDYLDAETALLNAKNSFAQALSDFEVSVLQYLRDTDQLRVDFSGHLQLPDSAPAAAAPTAPPATTTRAAQPAESLPK